MNKEILGKCGFDCGAWPTWIKGSWRRWGEEHTTVDCFTRDCVKKVEFLREV